MITKKTNIVNGVKYEIVESNDKIESTVSMNNDRIIYNGKVAFEKMSGSYKFGKQIQIVVFTKDVKIENRTFNNGFERIEIAIPYELGKIMFKEFIKKID
jgi:hypothetical protein